MLYEQNNGRGVYVQLAVSDRVGIPSLDDTSTSPNRAWSTSSIELHIRHNGSFEICYNTIVQPEYAPTRFRKSTRRPWEVIR